VFAQTGLSFDLSTASGKLMRTIMTGLAEFERDLIRDRVKSGLAAARAKGVKIGRPVGTRSPEHQRQTARRRLEAGERWLGSVVPRILPILASRS